MDFRTAGNTFIAESSCNRVQVMDNTGQSIKINVQSGKEDKFIHPTALHIADKYVYVIEVVTILWSSVISHLISEGSMI